MKKIIFAVAFVFLLGYFLHKEYNLDVDNVKKYVENITTSKTVSVLTDYIEEGKDIIKNVTTEKKLDENLFTWKDSKLFYADTINRKVSIYDKKQKKTLVFDFDKIPEPYFTEDEYSGLIVCVCDGKYGIIDHDGNIAESFIYPVNDDYIIHRGMHYVYFYDKQSTDFWLIQWGIGGKFYGGDLDIKNNH